MEGRTPSQDTKDKNQSIRDSSVARRSQESIKQPEKLAPKLIDLGAKSTLLDPVKADPTPMTENSVKEEKDKILSTTLIGDNMTQRPDSKESMT